MTVSVAERVRCAPRGVLVRGDRVEWRGGRYTIAGMEGVQVQLAADDGGPPVSVALPVLAAAVDFAVLDGAGHRVERAELPDFSLMEGIPEHAAQNARQWQWAVVEVDTGLLPGAPPGAVPRPAFDPASTTLIDRYRAKAAEMNAVLQMQVSWQTVQAKRLKYLKSRSVLALVDGRSIKGRRQYGLTDQRVVEQLLVLVERQRRRLDAPSDARKLFQQLRRAVRAAYGPEVKVPAEATLYKLLRRLGVEARDLAGARGGRPVGQGPVPPFSVTSATMPGELVQIDSTDLDVWVLGDDGQPARVELTAAVCVATRSIIAAVVRPKQPRQRGKKHRGRPDGDTAAVMRATGRATKAVDACELLAQALVPFPMRPTFDAAVHAAGSALPYEELVAVDERFAQAAARPVIIPDLIVIDHGTVFTSQTFFDACAYLGISVRPARRRTPQDKAIVERTFGSIKSMFSQRLNSYTGHDPVRVRRTVDGERLWTLSELDNLLQQWIVLEWQNRPHPELADPHDAYLPHLTPNEMYAACVEVDGYLPIPLDRDDYLRLLPTAWVGVSEQGIRLKNRLYDNPERDPAKGLNPYRRKPSGLNGKRRGRWEVRYTPNDPSRVWLRDHRTNRWVEATWVHQHKVGAPWTQFLWDIAASQHVARGGRFKDEEAIAEALAGLLERASLGPDRPGRATAPDGWAPLPSPAPARVFDPYAGRTPVDLPDLSEPVPGPAVAGGLLAFADTGLSPSGALDGTAIDWSRGALPPDPSLTAWEQDRPAPGAAGRVGTTSGDDLAERYRKIFVNALTGRFPDDQNTPPIYLSSLHLPTQLPISIPSTLIEHRPDIRAAEAQMHAANALIGVAIANRLPNFTIDASNAGTAATTLASLLRPDTRFWALAGIITQPIFNGGALRHKQRAAEATYRQAAAQYRATVINAYQNVADTLKALQADALSLDAANKAEQAARTSLKIYQRQLALGDTSQAALLFSQQNYQQAKLNLIQAQANRLSDTVALFQALGGGWQQKQGMEK